MELKKRKGNETERTEWREFIEWNEMNERQWRERSEMKGPHAQVEAEWNNLKNCWMKRWLSRSVN